jgi:translation elongation factor EF-Ts
MAGRIESYIHSDSITAHKGGVLVKVASQTDFAARTDEFIGFSQKVAKMAYAFGAGESESPEGLTWDELIHLAGRANMGAALEQERVELAAKLKETITVEKIVVLIL